MTNFNPMIGGNQRNPLGGQQIKIDLNQIPDAKCIRCGSTRFVRAGVIKVLSKVVSPNGQEAQANLERMECGKCYWPFDLNQYLEFQKQQDLKKQKEKDDEG